MVIDPKVQGDLDLLGRAFDIGFHHGDFACGGSGPTSDGRLLMQPHVREILYRQQAPAFEQVTAAQCPNYFSYSIDITVTTDNGVLSGTLTGKATHYENSEGGRIRQDVYVFAQAPAQDLSGRLGVRVNPARPWVARVGGQFKLGDDGTSQGQLFSSTDYTDVMLPSDCAIYDEGDGIYWPVPSPHNECGWLGAPRSSGSRMLTLDELRRLSDRMSSGHRKPLLLLAAALMGAAGALGAWRAAGAAPAGVRASAPVAARPTRSRRIRRSSRWWSSASRARWRRWRRAGSTRGRSSSAASRRRRWPSSPVTRAGRRSRASCAPTSRRSMRRTSATALA